MAHILCNIVVICDALCRFIRPCGVAVAGVNSAQRFSPLAVTGGKPTAAWLNAETSKGSLIKTVLPHNIAGCLESREGKRSGMLQRQNTKH